MILKAPGKINLALDVLSKREDGYHNIDMISVPIELHDCIETTELVQGNETYLTCDDLNILCDESNLAIRAYRAMQERFNIKKPYRIEIFKRIPVEAGLAGGSADAAQVILAVAKHIKPAPTQQELIEVATNVGCDVPFCLINKPMRVQGRGEVLIPIKMKKPYYVLIVKPRQGLATGDVYVKSDTMEIKHPNIDELVEGLQTGNEELIAKNLINSLEDAARTMCPDIEKILSAMKDMGFKLSSMSGSGSSCFALSFDNKKLQMASKYFASLGYKTYLTSTLL